VHLGEPILIYLQANPTRRIDEIDELPRNDTGTEAAGHTVHRSHRKPLEEAANGSAKADLDLHDPQRQLGFRGVLPVQIDIVDPYHLAAMDIDDLLIQKIAFQQNKCGVLGSRDERSAWNEAQAAWRSLEVLDRRHLALRAGAAAGELQDESQHTRGIVARQHGELVNPAQD
jgi:hypothetical protein